MFEEGAVLKARYGAENVCDFSLGNPDLSPPPDFFKVLKEIASEEKIGAHSYMPNAGYPEIRGEMARRISLEQGVELTGQDLLMTCGAAGGLNVVLKSLLNPGEEVVLLAPYFVEYNFYVDNHGGISRIVDTAVDFGLDLAAIEAGLNERTKAIIVNSPNNPTGQIYSEESLAGLAELLNVAGKKYGTTIYIISDEPYRKLTFDGNQVPSVMQAYRNSIVVSSFSKDLSLPGERIGYIAVHPDIDLKNDLLGALTLANRILGFVNAPALMQRVVGRLQGVQVDTAVYTRRRDKFCQILADCGYEFEPPKGAFYIFPKAPGGDDVKFAALLQEQKILAVPGCGFGRPGYFRLAFCVNDSVIERSAPGFKNAIRKMSDSLS